MSPTRSSPIRGNPFSTRNVRPGRIEFVFPPEINADVLVRRLADQNWRGAILGAHGSGKSTLLATMRPALQAAGRTLVRLALHDGQRRLAADQWPPARLDPTTLVVVDGYEQLGDWSRHKLQRACRRHGGGLLVTAHQKVGLPILFQVRSTPDVVRGIVRQLLAGDEATISDDDVTERLSRHGDNVREALFDLYDLVESRRRAMNDLLA